MDLVTQMRLGFEGINARLDTLQDKALAALQAPKGGAGTTPHTPALSAPVAPPSVPTGAKLVALLGTSAGRAQAYVMSAELAQLVRAIEEDKARRIAEEGRVRTRATRTSGADRRSV